MPKFATSLLDPLVVVEVRELEGGGLEEGDIVADFGRRGFKPNKDEWEFGDHESCPECGTDCHMLWDQGTPGQLAEGAELEQRKKNAEEYARFLNLKASLPTLDGLCSDLNADIVKLRMTAQLKYSTTIATNAHRIWVALRTLLNVPVAVPAPLDFDEKKWKERDGRGH